MQDIILHHYPTSPFAEKVRVAFGIKGLKWKSVTIPVIMPKPDLMPLTGGYRKTPVMQIGADIYCDTQCILRALERHVPEPSLYRGTDAGTANAMAFWSDRALFSPIVGVAFAGRAQPMAPDFIADRAKFSGRELNQERLKAATPMLLDQLRPQFGWYETILADGRPYLFGQSPTLVDCALYHLCWFLSENLSDPVLLKELPRIQAWTQRIKSIGHGTPSPLSAQDALAIARDAKPENSDGVQDAHDPSGRKPGDRVSVIPDDTGRDAVVGELIASSRDEIVIRRVDPQVGEIAVHFPRAGFVIQPA